VQEPRRGKKICPECGSPQKYQGLRTRNIHTGRPGILEIKRAYYTCQNKECSHTQMPLDTMLGISRHTAAGKFEEQICHLAAVQPFELVQKYLANFDQIEITETMIRETTENCGSTFIKTDEALQDRKDVIIPTRSKILYVQADGSMVPIRAKERGKHVEYRENKLGIVFREEDIERKPDDKCVILKKRFASSLGAGVEHFEQMLKVTAQRCGSAYAQKIVFISDGAEWLDKMRKRLFPKSTHILDWYHAEEHLWTCARKLFGEQNQEKMHAWVNPLKELLWNGMGEAVCERLLFEIQRHPNQQTPIRELYNYLKPRIPKMRYAEFRRKGYFIGSGAIESANKYLVQARLKQAGMKWTMHGASAVIKLREKLYEGTWDSAWCQKVA